MSEMQTAPGQLVGQLDNPATDDTVLVGATPVKVEQANPAETVTSPHFELQGARNEHDEALVLRLAAATGLDPASLSNAWDEEFGDSDPDAFLSFLLGRNKIDKQRFLRAHASTEIELTGTVIPSEGEPLFSELGYIDEGGVGEIRVARDVHLRRKVALKRLKKADEASPESTRRFIKEAQITAQLDHPNIVPIYAIENRAALGGTISFAMKLIDGKTLDDIVVEAQEAHDSGNLVDTPSSIAERLEHFIKVCDAIHYAHARGVIHRDLKPANIMVGKFGELYVMDWGVAKLLQRDDDPVTLSRQSTRARLDETRIGQVIGTPYYMSPEQANADNRAVDETSDIYSLGLILYELCCLKRAIPGKTWLDVVTAAGKAKMYHFKHVSSQVGRLPADLEAIFMKACSRKQEKRYQSAAELGDDVRRYLRGEEVIARPDNAPRRLLRWLGRHRMFTLLLVLGIVGVSATATIWSLYSQKRAVETAKQREEALTAWQYETAEHSAAIDRQFLKLEGLVRRLADNALFWLNTPADTITGERVYSMQEFADPAEAPTDYGPSSLYGKPVSIDYPVYKLAPGVQLSTVESELQRLAPLRHHYRQLFLESRPQPSPVGETKQRRLLTDLGVPLRWAYVGLKEGVMFSYPGKIGYPPDYDPRKRPWYELAEGHEGVRWGNPYIDLQGQGLILPAVMSLVDSSGEFHGVVGLEITFDEIIRSFLSRRDTRGVLETFLLDDAGRIVVRSSQFAEEYEGGVMHEALELEPYPLTTVRDEIGLNRSGQLEAEGKLIGYHRIPTLGWYYVEEVNPGELFKGQ